MTVLRYLSRCALAGAIGIPACTYLLCRIAESRRLATAHTNTNGNPE